MSGRPVLAGAHVAAGDVPAEVLGRLAEAVPDGPVRAGGGLALACAGASGSDGSAWTAVAGAVLGDGPPPPEVAAVTGLRGSFCVARFEPGQRRGYVARDHLGSVPLYFAEEDGGLRFATDVRTLLSLLRQVPAPWSPGVALWIASRTTVPGRSLYEGVRRVLPGHALVLRDGRWHAERFWRPEPPRPAAESLGEAAERLRPVIDGAVSRALGDARRPAVMMSGGLDSTSIAAIAQEQRPIGEPALEAWSATFPDHPEANELEEIAAVTAQSRLDGRLVSVREPAALSELLDYTETWRVPCPSPNVFYTAPFVRLAAERGVDVMLDGEGGDETFGASWFLMADDVRHGRLDRAWAMAGLVGARGSVRELRWLVRECVVKPLVPHRLELAVRARRQAEGAAPAWMRPAAAADVLGLPHPLNAWKAQDGPRWWAFQSTRLVEDGEWLGSNDYPHHRALGAGIAERHPFLHDVDLIEAALATDPRLAFHPDHDRPQLRAAMAGRLPDAVRLRTTKTAFNAVIFASLAGPDWAAVRALLRAGEARVGAYVDMAAVEAELLDRPAERRSAAWASYLWQLLTAELWLRSLEGPSELAAIRERWAPRPARLAVSPAQPPPAASATA
ncbi:MAG: hypothetical protein QOK49_1294 [Baekduia sp.]|nr:hypothetical protein [Baekduia sp.]